MKKSLIGGWAVLVAMSVLGQGILSFSNDNPIYGPEPDNPALAKSGNSPPQSYNGPKLAGANYWAQLYAGPTGASESSLAGCLPTTTFRTGAAAGLIAPVNVTLAGIPPGSAATIEMRVWDNSSGLFPSWSAAEPAWLSGSIAANKSDLLSVLLGGGITPPPQGLASWPSFNIYFIPEPATVTLLALGLGLWQLEGRRPKRTEGSQPPQRGI